MISRKDLSHQSQNNRKQGLVSHIFEFPYQENLFLQSSLFKSNGIYEFHNIKKGMIHIGKLARNISKIKPLKVTAHSLQDGIKIKSQTGTDVWELHNPLESLVATLVACELSTMRGLTHQRIGGDIKVRSMKFTKAESSYELQRFFKGGPENRINEINIEAEVETTGTQEQLDELEKHVINCCPVYQMFQKAGVKVNNKWTNIQVQ